ncbi:large membrane associated channel [Cryptosporidium ubiquitum]|uniref:Large membrane associated channel n=1 Tax=Cryptosporidium ubiquitum TaxID=857276 RepID=A0A1J4MIM4_9CRYT|nr:large membrane associated channel [Cryptosporidium ubiquitum]OII74081.1 large membrane associated channel [Cryptosporidium ubiquitum]
MSKMKFLTDIFLFWILSLIYFICSSLVFRTEALSNSRGNIPHLELFKGNKQGLLRQHRMVGEFLECTYVEHIDPTSQEENGETYYPGTGTDRSKSRVVSLESIDISGKIIKTLECQKNLIRNWIEDINKTLKGNLFSVIEVRGWRAMTRPQSLYGEADEILTILENKNSSPLNKVKEAVDAFDKYVMELYEAYSEFKNSEDRLKDAQTEEERRTRAQVAVLILGQKENKALVNFTRIVRNNSDDARESKRLMERLFSLLSSESYSNNILQGIELVQICFFLLNGLNVLSVFEEQRLSNKFRRDMERRNLTYQYKIEDKTLSKYPKFSNSPNFKKVTDFLLSTVKKSITTENEKKIKDEFIQIFDKIVEDFGIRCPYFLTSILRSGRDNYFLKGEEMFDYDIVKNCRLAWSEISSYLYKEGQIVPSAAIRQALKKALNKHVKTVYIWTRNASGLFKKIFDQSSFENSFDISNEKRFISTCSETINGEIGLDTPHAVSLDEIAIICFNFFNLLEFYTDQYNYGNQEKLGKDGKTILATKRYVNISTLPSKIKAKSLDVAFSETLTGILDFPPFKSNDLDRTVIGILTENFTETCTQRIETVLGKSSKYRISNPQIICEEARIILKDYNIISQKPEKVEGTMDIFEQFNILDTSLITETTKSESENLDAVGHLKLLQSKLGSLQPKSQRNQSKDTGISPIKELDPIKAYNLVRKMHLDWMEQMRNDPRYKGFTDLELKNNSPWSKQMRLWHDLIVPELPEVRYAASYLNDRPSRFPLISGDKRGKHKKITPLEELINEDLDPRYRARYSLVENGPFDEQEFYYDDQYDDVDGDSIATELAQTKEYYIKTQDGSYIKNKKGSYIKEKDGKYTQINKGDYLKKGRSYIKNRDFGYHAEELDHFNPSGADRYGEQIIAQKVKPNKKYFGSLHNLGKDHFPNSLYAGNGCKNEELPLLWGQRATILHKNMIKNFKEVKYRGKYGPGHFISMDDICYIFERDFKVKRNYFEDISKVNLLDCQNWFTKYLSKLWPPFSMESLKTDVKTLCWDSGFRSWL